MLDKLLIKKTGFVKLLYIKHGARHTGVETEQIK